MAMLFLIMLVCCSWGHAGFMASIQCEVTSRFVSEKHNAPVAPMILTINNRSHGAPHSWKQVLFANFRHRSKYYLGALGLRTKSTIELRPYAMSHSNPTMVHGLIPTSPIQLTQCSIWNYLGVQGRYCPLSNCTCQQDRARVRNLKLVEKHSYKVDDSYPGPQVE